MLTGFGLLGISKASNIFLVAMNFQLGVLFVGFGVGNCSGVGIGVGVGNTGSLVCNERQFGGFLGFVFLCLSFWLGVGNFS